MNTPQQAAEELRTFGRKLQAVMALVDELDKWGSVENALMENNVRLESLRQEEARLLASVEELARSASDARNAQEVALRQAESLLVDARKEAESEAVRIVRDGAQKADSMVAAAEHKVEALSEHLRKRHAELAALEDHITERAHQLEALRASAAEIGRTLSALQ
jgi:chromosome segregation ATPase